MSGDFVYYKPALSSTLRILRDTPTAWGPRRSGRGRLLIRSLAPPVVGSTVAATRSMPLMPESSPLVPSMAMLIRQEVFVGSGGLTS